MYSVVGSDGQVYGPVDTATLQQWIAEGRVVPTTNLVDPLDGRVIQAGQAPALMGTFPTMPTQAPPAPGPYAQNPYTQGPFAQGSHAQQPQAYNGYPRPDMMPYYGPPKTKLVAILLAFFLGGFGIHRFYLGHTSTGIAMLVLTILSFVTCGATAFIIFVWAIVDIILIATDSLREANGRALN